MMRIKLIIEYDGSVFSGWQIQPSIITVQEELENAFQKIYQKKIRVHGSGRTDSGVHARGQTAHCDVPNRISLKKLKLALNGTTNKAVTIHKIIKVQDNFNSRFDAKARRYRYFINEKPISIQSGYSWFVSRKLDIEYLNQVSLKLLGKHDFESFAKKHSGVDHFKSIIYEVRWFRKNGFVIFEIKAIRFLRGMVRALVGTLLNMEKLNLEKSHISKILEMKSRSAAGINAPAHGLILEEVYY
jgi:tRNA pseudouridine38-40 synthase